MITLFSNPHRFMALSRWLAPVMYVLAAVLISISVWLGLYELPAERVQGDSARILIIHVPSAILSTGTYMGMAVMSFVWFIWRHELADMAAKAIAPIGMVYTGICLLTGAIWGKPTWGTWFEWDDPRMLFVLILFFLFMGYLALRSAMPTRKMASTAGAIVAMVGVIMVPLIKYSVEWFTSLHQDASFTASGSSMSAEFAIPLFVAMAGHGLLCGALTLSLMRASVWQRRADVIRARWLAEGTA